MKIRVAIGAALTVAAWSGARAQEVEHGAFITRLGSDTIAVEQFVATRDSIVGEMVARTPRLRRYTYVARLARDGSVAQYTMQILSAVTAGAPARVTIHVDFRGDSVRQENRQGDSTRHLVAEKVPGMFPVLEPAYAPFEALTRQAIAAKGARIPQAEYYLGETYAGTAILAKPDLVIIATKSDTVLVHIDRDGRILGLTDPGGTLQATVVRVPSVDINQWATMFAALDAQGKGIGQLSPRDTVRAVIGGTHVLVDYGRPSRRGRAIFGNVVPFNTIWRTGANAATTLVIDHDMMLGATRVPAGTYTLFSVPTATDWMLVVSKKTGEWGTEYDPTADLARVPMDVSTVKDAVERFTISLEPEGAMALVWDTRSGRVSLKPPTQGN